MSTVLLTGASGFIALHTLNELLSRGYNVLAVVRSAAKEAAAQECVKSHPDGSLTFFLFKILSSMEPTTKYSKLTMKLPP